MSVFINADARCTSLTDADVPRLTLLGDVNIAEAQNLQDMLAGGAAGVCTSRVMGVQ